MKIKSVIKRSAFVIGVLAASAFADNSVTIRPSKPTHYLFTPMARVNEAYHMVAGLHELSFALPGRLQIQASIIDNIGKTNLAAKYGFTNNMAIGVGYASTLVGFGQHGIPRGDGRVGAFLTYAFVDRGDFSMAMTPHTQIGDRFSVGCDFGLMTTPSNVWSVIGEAGLSLDTYDSGLYLFAIAGLRIHPPAIPFMNFDIGVGTNEFDIEGNRKGAHAVAFFDVMICFITM